MPRPPVPPPRARLAVTPLEARITPVLGAFEPAPRVEPGTGFDGVVQLLVGDGTGTGALLWTGRHILTAAHVVTNSQGIPDQPVTVYFDLLGQPRVPLVVPAGNIRVREDFNPGTLLNDIAILELPTFAPVEADRYQIYRGSNEIGQAFTIVGYGRVGTGVTGELPNLEGIKHKASNRYDTYGDRLWLGQQQTLIYDFDNARPANDALGRLFQLNDLGIKDEGNAARGDSGGPTFFAGANGLPGAIVGVTSGSLNATRPANPAVLNPSVETGFGTISLDTRVAFHAGWIDETITGRAAISLDLRTQTPGYDPLPDTVRVGSSEDGQQLELHVNEILFERLPWEQVGTLTVIGAGDQAAPFPTVVEIDAEVPAWLSITLERIGGIQDARPVRVTSPRNDVLIPVENTADENGPPILIPSPSPDADPLPLPPPSPTPGDPSREESPRPIAPIDLSEVPSQLTIKRLIALGAGAGGGPRVRIWDPVTQEIVQDFFPFEPSFRGGVQTALADVNGDGTLDWIVAAGVGGGPRVAVYDGATGRVIFDEFVYEPELRGGVTVGAADFNRDGRAELVVGAGISGGPRVRVLDLTTGLALYDFFAFDSAQRGGVQLSLGDLNNDGTPDLILGAGVGTEPMVRVLDGLDPNLELRSFAPYLRTYLGGVSVAAGDLNGDGRVELITAPANGGGAHIRIYNGRDGQELNSFFAFDPALSTGARVGIADLNRDGQAELVVGQGPGGGLVRTFSGIDGVERETLLAFDENFTGGVFVG